MSDQTKKRPAGLKLVVAFLVMSASTSLVFAALATFVVPGMFPVPDHLQSLPEAAAPEALLRYALGLLLAFVFSAPLLFGGLAKVLGLSSSATSLLLLCAALLFGLMAWELYRLQNWARRMTRVLCMLPFLAMLMSFPPFWAHSVGAIVAFLPFAAPYGLMFLYLRSENLLHQFGVGALPVSLR